MNPRLVHRGLIMLILAGGLLSRAAALDAWSIVEEHWYAVEMAGRHAGSLVIIVERDEAGGYRTSREVRLTLGRVGDAIEIATRDTFIESADGRPIRMSRVEQQAQTPIHYVHVFHDDHVEQVVTSGRRETRTKAPRPEGVWLTPRAADQYVRARRGAGANEIEYRTVQPETGLTPITMHLRRLREDVIEHRGREIPVTIWETRSDHLDVASVDTISSDGILLAQTIRIGALEIEMRLADREAIEEASGGRPPELVQTQFVQPDRPMLRVRDTTEATYRLRMRDGVLPALPTTGAQRVEVSHDRHCALVRIRLDEAHEESIDEADRAAAMASSAMIDLEDPMLKGLAELDDVVDAEMEAALALRRRVYEHIVFKGFDVGFASASEAARSRRGDCSEHAVLLAALLRINGIPSRIATGLMYVEAFEEKREIFAWHMWTQAWIDGRWVDLDATLPDQRFHAGYILVAISDLADDRRFADMTGWITLLGNVDIDVLEYAHNRADD